MHADGSAPPVVVFDGACVMCSGWVRFLLRHDRAGTLRFAAMQGTAGGALLRAAGLDADDPASFLFVRDGRAATRSDAIVWLLASLGGRWWWASRALRAVPRGWRDAAYLRLARSRYRWFGRRDACLVPDDATHARFLP